MCVCASERVCVNYSDRKDLTERVLSSSDRCFGAAACTTAAVPELNLTSADS